MLCMLCLTARTVSVPLFDSFAFPTSRASYISVGLRNVIVSQCTRLNAYIFGELGKAHVVFCHALILNVHGYGES